MLCFHMTGENNHTTEQPEPDTRNLDYNTHFPAKPYNYRIVIHVIVEICGYVKYDGVHNFS